MDYSLLNIALLIGTGFIAGIINTLAGGGSNLTLPALMVMGMPADVANATNRVGVFLQGISASLGFKKAGKLDTNDILPVMIPSLIGGLVGAFAASYAPEVWLKPLLLGAMICMTLIMIFRPSLIVPPEGTQPFKIKEKPSAWLTLFFAGVYGGFVQAGVGFILIAALAGTLRYDLVRTNALKMICTMGFTALALGVFIWNDQVLWLPGLILACGTISGSYIAVKLAIKAQPKHLKWFLFIMTVCGSIAALSST
ncbi:sulfite exporter TauE/SafE family protein [Marinomonas sp. C2222]|uniref:Probable membrane transporter protein n=1 Tax=Marinomonas sargassi TaxID=2984494 RepID=A0ABT2YQP7_9GAMM|nr:sulfite exporter TauE/SafE family protein [Marinomonas sargassi]MCV2401984.1 sulfite exporter TauE/SafE family protein [Marinomonas sargassi]